MTPSLEFYLKLPTERHFELIPGVLIIKEKSGGNGMRLKATSGLAQWQYKFSWGHKGRGCLPPSEIISPHKYTVSTQRLWMPNIKGVEGSFYAIAPFSVAAGNKASRGDFGIHFDANVPGSAGCIVIQLQDHWDIFRQLMDKFRAAKFQSIPLLVIYI